MPKPYEPTEEEIARAAAEIRAGWSERETRRRYALPGQDTAWNVPYVTEAPARTPLEFGGNDYDYDYDHDHGYGDTMSVSEEYTLRGVCRG